MAEDWGTNDPLADDDAGLETWGESDPVVGSEQDQQDWGIDDPVVEGGNIPMAESAKPSTDIVQQYGELSQRYNEKGKAIAQSAQRFEQLASQPERTPEEESELASSWEATLQGQADISRDAAELRRLQPEYDKYFADQKQARIKYIEDRRGSGIFGDEAAEALYDIDARAEQEYAQARTIEDDQKRKQAMAAIQARYQTEEKDLTNRFVERFKDNETKINNAADVIGKAFASGQSLDQFLLETEAAVPEYDELRNSLLNQDDPEKGKLFREAMAMHELAIGRREKAGPADTWKLGAPDKTGTTEAARVGIINNEIRISPLHVWDAEGIKSEINALDISDAKKRTAIATIPQLQKEAAKVELPFLQQVSEFNSFVKDNNLENVSPQRQISEWKSRNENWLDYISKAPAQVGIGLKTGTLGLLEAGQAIVGATALTMGAQEFADPFLDAATKTSDEVQRLNRISQEIGGPTFAAELAAVVPQIVTQIGVGGAVGFGGTKLGLKPKTVSNIGFGSSVGTAFAQSYGGVLSSAFQQLEKEKIDGGMDPVQARAEAVKEAQLPAAISGLSTAVFTVLGGKRGAEAVFRDGVDGIKAKLNTAAFRAELPKLVPNIFKGMRNEGYEEFADQLAQGIIEQFSFNPQLSTSDIINNAFKALAIGGITGGTVEGLKYGFDYMKAPKEMARREASMASVRQSIADVEREISDTSASSPIGAEFQREYDATLPSDEAASLGGVAVDRSKMNRLQSEREQLASLLEDETMSRVARNDLEGKLAAADLAYYNEILAPMRRNVVNEQIVDQLDAMTASDQTKDGIRAMAKIANGLGAESLTGRERVAVGITSVGGGRFLPSRKNPMVEVDQAGQAKVTEAGRLMAENVGMAPLVRMIGLSETTRAKQAEMERVVAEAEARKAQQDAKDTAESEEAKRYGPASAEALKQQVTTQPPAPEKESNARLAQLLKEQEETARLGEEAVTKAVEARFIESFRSTMSEAIIPTAERAATIDLNNFRDVINNIAKEIDKGTFKIELIEQGEFKNILPESAFTTVVEAFKENPQRALNALRAFGDEVENAVKEFGGGAAGEPEEPAEVVSIRRVLRAEQTPEDVTALTEAGLVEVYKDQPILTQAGIDALPEAERPRLTPEARKIQIDTGASDVLAEAISKGLRIGIDQVPPAFKMPEGWTLDGDIYIPPAPPVAPPVEPPVAPPVQPTEFKDGGIIERNGKQYVIMEVEERKDQPARLRVKSLKDGKPFGKTFFFGSEDPKINLVQPPVAPPVTPPPVAPTAGAITEEQANNAIKAAQEERARKPAQDIGRSRWGAQSIAPKQSIGKTVREALKTASRLNLSKIAKSDPNEIMMQDVAAILAELDMPILDLEPIKSLASLRKKGRPRRWGGGQSVIGLPSTIPMPVEYLVHEAGHTITADQVRRYLPREKFARGKGYLDAINKVIADPKTPEPIGRLFSLYVSTIEQLGIADQYFVTGGIAGGKSADASKALAQRAQAKGLIRSDIKPSDFYGLANVEEFVSQTFSEQSFRDLLKSLKDPTNPRQSLWQAFVDAIQRVLQLPKGTMAAAVVEASVDVGMLVEPDRVKARGAAGVTPAPAPEPDMAYAGEQADTPQFMRDSLSVAQAMAAKKADPQTIRRITGWIVNPYDGKLRWEIPDNNASLKNAWDYLKESPMFGTPIIESLGNVLSHPPLFAAYPDLANVTILRRTPFLDFFRSIQGSFDEDKNEIIITPYAVDPISTILHEVQHWIQKKEGFARGSNTQKAMEILTPNQKASIIAEMQTKADDMTRSLQKKFDEAWQLRDHLRGIQVTPERVAAFDLAAQEKQRTQDEYRKLSDTLPVGDPARTAAYNADEMAKKKLWQAAGIDSEKPLDSWNIAYPVLFAKSFNQIMDEAEKDFAKLEKEISSPYEIIANASKDDQGFKAAIEKFGLAHELYKRVAGEIEARDVQARIAMTPEERKAAEPYSSENIAPELAIVTFTSPSATTEEADMAPEPEEAPTGIIEGEEVQLEGGDLLRAMKTQSETQYAGKIGRISGKEIFQNSVDAIMKITPQQEAQRGVPKAIYVGTQPKFFRSKLSSGERANLENRIPSDDQTTDETINLRGDDLIVYDTGTGMTPSVVIDKFLRAFVSGKTVGEGGGFGQAKLAFLGGSKYFKVATVAEDANGKKYVTILEGAGDAFYMFNLKPPKVVLRPMTKITLAAPPDGIPMTLEYFEVPPETITGTAIVSEIVGGYSDGAMGGKNFISDVVKYVDGISFLDMDSVTQPELSRSDRGTFHVYPTSRNTPLEFLGFSTPDASALNPIKMEFGLLKSVDLPSATVDFLARANDAYEKRSYASIKILNRSIYQFDEDVFFDEEVALPNEVVVNIKPKVKAGSKDYPFTTSRENLSGDVKSEVSRYFKNVGQEAIKKLNDQFEFAKNSAIPIPNSKQAFLDVGQNNDATTLNSIASAPSTIAINEDIAFGQDTILKTLNMMYPNKFGRASYAGFITGGRSFGVHFGNRIDPSTVWHDPWLQLSRAKDTWRDSSMGDIFDIDFDTATDQEINDFYDFYLRQSYGVSFHEALHQIIDEEGEGLARELTFRTGDLLYGFLTSTIPNNKTADEKRAILKELETNAATLAANVNQKVASQFITAQGGYSGYALAERGREEGAPTEAGRVLPAEGAELAPEEEFEIIPEQVEDQIEGTPEAATINVMGQAFQMANEQSAAMGTAEGTLPLETITSAWMNSGRDVETLENAIIRYTNLEPEAAATLAQAISKQVDIQRGIMEISDAASRRKAEKEAEPEIKPYSFAQRIKEDLPPELRNKIELAYEVLRNEVSVEEANRVMSGLTLDEAIKATTDMKNEVSMPVRSMMAQIVLRKIMDRRKSTKGKKGKEGDYRAAVEAHVEFLDFVNDYFKELGQGVQAIARFSDLGADGVLLKVRKDIDKAISKHITNRKGQIEKIKRDVKDADDAAFKAAINANKDNIDKTAKKAGEQEAKKMTIEEQAQKLAIRAAKKVAGEEVRRRQPDPLSDLVNGHLRRYNANFIAEATAMGVSPVTAQAIEDSAKKLRDSRQAAKAERERFKEMQEERMKVKKELARENKYIYGERPTIWEDYQQMFSERLARRLMRDPKKKVPPSLLLFTDRLTENLLGFVPETERQATTQRSFQAMIEDALNNREKYQEAFDQALEDISLKVMELEARVGGGEAVPSSTYKRAVAAQEFMERLAPIVQDFPVSDKLVMRFTNQKMKAMGQSLVSKYNDWYRASRKTRIDIEKQLAETLVADLKVNYADSIKLSQAIIKDFRAKAEERREKALARFKKPKEKAKRLAESPLKKFFELVNIGAMTDKDAYEVMAQRFDLPTWDPKFAKQIEEMALILEDMPEGMERRRLTRNMMAEIARRKGFSLSDLGAGFFYSNMLSSVETFLINLQDTLIGNFVNGLASSVAEKDFSRMSGLISGYRKGWKEAVQVFRTGLRINMPRLEEKTPLTVELINYGKKGGVALESTEGMNAIAKTLLESPPAKFLNLWKYITRIMEATDALNYAASSEGQRYAEAAKMAKDEGLEGKAKQKRINQILNLGDDVYQAALKQAEQEGYTGTDAKFRAMEIQDSEIDAELREKSFNRALIDVYRNMPTGLAGATAAQFNNYVMRIANPWFRNAFKLFIAPFVITPTNLFNRWLDYSPYGYKRLFYGSGNLLDKDTPYYVAPPKVGSAEFYTQALKASSSVLVMGLAYGLTKAGLLVLRGMGPSDEEERKQWLADGNRPHTFSFMGGPQISYQFTPWALVLSWMANYQNWEQYNAKEDASGYERAIVAMTSATSVIMDLPFFAGPAEFLDAIQSKKGDPVAALGKYAEGKMGMVFPNFVRQIDRIFDPTLYDSQGIKGIILDQMPFARRLGTQRVNLFGDPIGEDKPIMDRLVGRIASFPTKPSRESRILAKYDIYPYMPSPKEAKALVDGEEAQMTEEQYNKFVQIVGRETKQRINDLFDPDAEITEKERERGKKRISQIFERARARAVREVSTY